jgi:hypothetical protein
MMRRVLTLLAAARTIDGVECRIVEDREFQNRQLIESTRDYYAIVVTGLGPVDESVLTRAAKITMRDNDHTTAEIRRQ